jgi:Domain of unknown function (DUF4281)
VSASALLSTTFFTLAPETVFSLASFAVMPLYGLMVARPGAKVTRRILDSDALWLCLAALYGAALAQSWRSDTLALMFSLTPLPHLPQLSNIAAMFTRPAAAAATWVHLLTLDLFVARGIFNDARAKKVPSAHSLLLCMMFGPSGLLCHAATVALVTWFRRRTQSEKAAEA